LPQLFPFAFVFHFPAECTKSSLPFSLVTKPPTNPRFPQQRKGQSPTDPSPLPLLSFRGTPHQKGWSSPLVLFVGKTACPSFFFSQVIYPNRNNPGPRKNNFFYAPAQRFSPSHSPTSIALASLLFGLVRIFPFFKSPGGATLGEIFSLFVYQFPP